MRVADGPDVTPALCWGGFPASHKREKAAETAAFRLLDSLKETGAGEAIRTLDPNLGKVVLYP